MTCLELKYECEYETPIGTFIEREMYLMQPGFRLVFASRTSVHAGSRQQPGSNQ